LVYGLEIGEERKGNHRELGKTQAWAMNLHLECYCSRIILSLSSPSATISSSSSSSSFIHSFIHSPVNL
jgi:hypothetical protein